MTPGHFLLQCMSKSWITSSAILWGWNQTKKKKMRTVATKKQSCDSLPGDTTLKLFINLWHLEMESFTAWQQALVGGFVAPVTAHFSAQYVASVGSARETAATIPLYYLCPCAVTPAWTAYAPPRGAAAACSESSSAAGCSRCCLPEGQTRQTMTTKRAKQQLHYKSYPSETHWQGAWDQRCYGNVVRERLNDLYRYFSTQFSMK